MVYQSGLSVAMRKLLMVQELWNHSYLTARTCRRLISLLPQDYLSVSPENLCLSALFHDLGKIDWPEHWFHVPKENLTDNELQLMQEHPVMGARMLENLVPGIPKDIIQLVATHHERPGGKGYPRQIKEPSKEALILAACDVYCACSEPRRYRECLLTPYEALEIVAEFAPQEVIDGLWVLQKEGCHEHFSNVAVGTRI